MLTRMEQKLEELKTYLNEKFLLQKESLSDIAKDICTSMLKKFEDVLKDSQEEMKKQNLRVEKLESEKSLLQQHISELKQVNIEMQKNIDDNEQYGRRLCLRFDGLPVKENETSSMVLEDVKSLFEEAGIEIPDTVIDRAHRIGKGYTDPKTQKKCKSVIMRFTTFRHRTIVYRSKKKLRNGVKVRLDLTKRRHDLLSDASKLVANNNQVLFCFADINCRLKVKWADDSRGDNFFTTLDELESLLANNE